MGLSRATSGSARVLGLDCWHDAVAAKRHIGYMPGELPNFGGMRGAEIVAYVAGLRSNTGLHQARDIAARFTLDLGRRYREYSLGNKKKLALVLAFMHRPDLLILDEPTSGLDPLNQQTFFALLHEARQHGATIFLSSHVLSEVEHVCDRVAIIRSGRLVQLSSLASLRAQARRYVTIEFVAAPPVDRLTSVPGVDSLRMEGNQVHCTINGEIGPLLAAIAGQRVRHLTSREPALEDLFLDFYQISGPASLPAANGTSTGSTHTGDICTERVRT